MSALSRTMLVLALLVVVLVLVACSPSDDGPRPDASASPELVVRLERLGGFLPVGADVVALPAVSVYSDGSVLAHAPVAAVYPGPLVVPLERFTVPNSEVDRLLSAAEELGLTGEDPLEFGFPPIADAGATVVTIRSGDGYVTHSAEALSEAAGDTSGTLSEEEQDARRRLSDFVERLQSLPREDGAIWEPSAYRVTALPVDPSVPSDPGFPVDVVPWPLEGVDPVPLAASNARETVVVSGDAALELSAVISASTALTVFVQDGVRYQLLVRPLLPDEL